MFPVIRDRSLIPLSHQHHNALALCVLTDRSLAADSSAANIAKLAGRVIDRYEIEMRNHFELEETVLFPRLPGTEPFIEEHRTLEAMVASLRAAPTAQLLADFTVLLRSHVRKEENDLFQTAQRILSRETLDEIGAIFDARAVRVCL